MLVDFGMDALAEDAVLLISELATNAVVHAGTAFEVTCVDLGAAVRIEVHDRHPSRELPAALPEPDPTREGGRGLLACAALAAAWGVDYTHDGKTVWCRLDAPERLVAVDRVAASGAAGGGHGTSGAEGEWPGGPVPVAVVSTDADDRVQGWNVDAERLFGWTAEQVAGQPLAALRDHTTDLDTTPDSAAGRWLGEVELRHRDGYFVRGFAARTSRPATPATGDSGAPTTVWLVVPVAHREVLGHPAGAPDDNGGQHWAAFSRAEVTRLDLGELLNRAVQRACDAIEGDAAYVALFDEDGGGAYVSASTGLAVSAEAALPSADDSRVSRDRLPAVYDDLTAHPSLLGLSGTSMRSAVAVPLLAEGRLIGQLVVASTTPGCFDNHDAVRMQQAADHLALSIEACRIAELARRNRGWLGYLADASDLLAGTLDPRMTLAMLAQLMVPRLAAWCAIGTRDARDHLELSHVWHEDETRIDDLRELAQARLADLVDTGDGTVRGILGGQPTLHLPLRARGRSLGTVVIGEPVGRRFGQDTVELAEELARRAALTLDNALLYRNQLTASEALQASLLPARLPEVPQVEIGAAYRASGEGQEVGGDFYDVFATVPGRWRFTIGDVCGSGPAAAAVTGQARHVLRILGRQQCPIADAVRQLNEAVCEETGLAPFLTLLHGEISVSTDGIEGAVGVDGADRFDGVDSVDGVYGVDRGVRVELVAAGHPLPYLLDPGGEVRPVGTPQPLLGVMRDVRYTAGSLDLRPGQSLLCVTDGVLERRHGPRMLGEDDLDGLLAQCVGLSAVAAARLVRRTVVEYAPAPPRDDLAVLILRALDPRAA